MTSNLVNLSTGKPAGKAAPAAPAASAATPEKTSEVSPATLRPKVLATVAEEAEEGALDVEQAEEKLDYEQDDPYAADPDALEALQRIDKQLQQIVPEREWEAKSIASFPFQRSLEDGSQSRSIWSSGLGSSSAPGELVLREQFEERESAAALAAIDDSLLEFQTRAAALGEGGSAYALEPPPSPRSLKKLLLEAAQASAPPDASTRVLALTSEGGIDAVDGGPSRVQENIALVEARRLLDRLTEMSKSEDVFNEEQVSLEQLALDVQELEALPQPPGPAEVEEPALEEGASQWIQQLQDLSQEAAAYMERRVPGDDLQLAPMAEEPLTEDNAEQSDGDEDFGNLDGGEPMRGARDFHIEVPPAIDIQLPTSDGVWDDEELDRISRALDSHYGGDAQDAP
mmetsp:Transcript_56204/g.121612  ORF Transcript_56204/g.121612 Transcript_56204/m.121612 type:complete len:400 (+) Transcript_56204:3-1202(+)